MKHRINYRLLLAFAIFCAVQSTDAAEAGGDDLFWKNRIAAAIALRNEAFGALIPESVGISVSAWPQPLRSEALRRIDTYGEGAFRPWYLLIRGLIPGAAGSGTSYSYCSAALDAAADEPGTLWLLFIEFDRYSLHALADSALFRLEKLMFESGGRASVIISNQLIHLGQIKKNNREDDAALRCFTWAGRFNPSETASIRHRIRLASILHPVVMVKTAGEMLGAVKSSWKAQLECFGFWYETARRALFLFVFFIVSLFALKYLPAAIHQATHLYPDRLSPPVRTLLASAVIISLSAFGLIPFFWFLAILLWRLSSRSERLLLGGAVALLALSPLDSAVMERLDRLRNPQGSLMKLSRALDEGRDPLASRQQTPSVYRDKNPLIVSNLIPVLDDLKNGRHAAALRSIAPLAAERPDDPVVSNIKGIIHLLGGSVDSAATCFSGILESYPRNVAATFNLSRCHLRLNDATAGMDLLKNAAMLDPATVNSFIECNDRYFSGNWPPLRSVMFPDYTPLQFWKWFFLASPADASAWRDYWGISFFGISPKVSLILFVLMFTGLVMYPRFVHRRPKPRRLFECKYCGRITCRKCSAGVLCSACAGKTLELRGSRSFGETIERIADGSLHSAGLRNALLSLFVPGSRSLLGTTPAIPAAAAGILAASLIYAYWQMLLGGVPFSWMTSVEQLSMFSIPLLFHLSCTILHLPAAWRHLGALLRSDSSKERSTDGTERHPA